MAQNRIHVGQHISSGDAKHENALRLKPCRSPFVMNHAVWLAVALAIDLDGQPRIVTIEIQNVGADRMLSAKAQTRKPTTAKGCPHQDFRQRHLAAKFARAFDGLARGVHRYSLSWKARLRQAPSTAVPAVPLPQGGRND